ncbi:hypothetical protein Nmel_004936, partial [Mimus melanotis]
MQLDAGREGDSAPMGDATSLQNLLEDARCTVCAAR